MSKYKYRVFDIDYDDDYIDKDTILLNEIVIELDSDDIDKDFNEYNFYFKENSDSVPPKTIMKEAVIKIKLCDKVSDITRCCINSIRYEMLDNIK